MDQGWVRPWYLGLQCTVVTVVTRAMVDSGQTVVTVVRTVTGTMSLSYKHSYYSHWKQLCLQ